jgi:hypothetical protein
VQLKDKLIEGRDAAHSELQTREESTEHEVQLDAARGQNMPESVVEALHNEGHERRAQLLGAVRMILGRQRIEIGQLRMPAREAQALTALQAAVEGRTSDLNSFVYAEDRRDLLERALGVLQPDLAHTDDVSAQELQAQIGDLSERLMHLRHQLTALVDAQDEVMLPVDHVVGLASESGDKPKPKPSDPDAPRPPTTLTGPEVPAPRPVPTTLTGPEVPAPKPVPTTLIGPEVPDRKPVPTTLTGADVPDRKPVPSTLSGGPDVPETAAAPSTLAAESAAAESAAAESADPKVKRPWWRRPFG